MKINIICVGKLKEKFWRDASLEYQKRLGLFCKLNITEICECKAPANPSDTDIHKIVETEGELIMRRTAKSLYIALCIEGDMLSSHQLSQKMSSLAVSGVGELTFVIGGSWGLSSEVKKHSLLNLSMSRMTFPHNMARILLLEQLYRAFHIANDGKYHK